MMGLLAAGIATVVLVGWVFDVRTLKSGVPGLETMKANTAVTFLLAGTVLLVAPGANGSAVRRHLSRSLAALVVLLGVLNLAETVVGWLDIDQVLFRDTEAMPGTAPGRMAVTTAVAFVLLGAALILLQSRHRRLAAVAEPLAGAASALAVLAIVGYAYQEHWLSGLAGHTKMALTTAVALGAVAVGVVGALPESRLVRLLTLPDAIGWLGRILLPTLFAVPLLLGGLAMAVVHVGLVPLDYAVTVVLLAMAVLMLGAVAITVSTLARQQDERLRHEAEELAWRQVDRFFTLSLDLICTASSDGFFTRLNPSWSRVLGYSEEELLTTPYLDLVHPDDRESTIAAASRIEAGNDLVRFRNRYRCRDGSYRILEWSSRTDEDGTHYSVARDVTEMMALQGELAEKASLVDHAHDAIVVMDAATFRIEDWNSGAMQLYGYTSDEAEGRIASDLLRTAFSISPEKIRADLERDGNWEGELVHHTKAGQEVVVESRMALLPADSGRPRRALEINRDVTARRRADAELRELNATLEHRVERRTEELRASVAELEAFTYSVAHDLRAPLRAMSGLADILVEDYGAQLDADAGRIVVQCRKAAVRMGQLIDGLLDFARLGRASLTRLPLEPAAIAKRAWEQLSAERGDRRVELSIGSMPACSADPTLLEQVYANLLSNALKYTRERPVACIEAGACEHDGETVQYVRDNGIGFEMRYAEQIFGVFKRLHVRDEYEGSGIGLAMVQRIVERHGGQVWAEATPGQGATFFFTLGR